MIKKMRYQFILVTMAAMSFIFILILCVINMSMTFASRNQGYSLLYRLADMPKEKEAVRMDRNFYNEKHKPEDSPDNSGNPSVPPSSPVGGFDAFRSFSVYINTGGEIEDIYYNENSGLDEDTIRSLAETIIEKKNPSEKGVSSKYLYIIKQKDAGQQIFFLDYSLEKSISLRLFWTCLFIGLIGILFIFLLVVFLSRWIVKPVQDAFTRQKQFIADASHELKTPLTIITTNAEVLSGSIGGNKWLNHILAQTARMSALIKNLLELAKLDSYDQSMDFLDFDMSKAVLNAALSFESLAFEYGKKYEIDIAEHITLHGNENSIRQLTTILLDNAFKYSDGKGTVSIRLHRHGEKKILTVENTGKGISAEEQKRIFERFYRSDASRSRESGGYGLGLSIASSISEIHKGHISVKSDEDSYTRFTVTLP